MNQNIFTVLLGKFLRLLYLQNCLYVCKEFHSFVSETFIFRGVEKNHAHCVGTVVGLFRNRLGTIKKFSDFHTMQQDDLITTESTGRVYQMSIMYIVYYLKVLNKQISVPPICYFSLCSHGIFFMIDVKVGGVHAGQP